MVEDPLPGDILWRELEIFLVIEQPTDLVLLPLNGIYMKVVLERLGLVQRARIFLRRVGGVILFTRHWTGRAALTRLIAEMKDLRPDLLVAVDHEGGRVQRFRDDGYTPLPAMGVLGRRWRRDAPGQPGHGALQAMEAATAVGHVLGTSPETTIELARP